MPESKPKVLFVCTANACRSQIAEGWARALRSNDFEAYSAGVMPAGVSPRAVAVMAEAGVDISAQQSKHIDELDDIDFECIVTLCDNARQQCPVFPRASKIIHSPVEDPTFAGGGERDVAEAFRKTSKLIRRMVKDLKV